jgi:hypothetical protein
MRLVSQSTRTTIRTITVIAAFTALVFALLAPLAGSAHAASLSAWNDAPYYDFNHDPEAVVSTVSGSSNENVSSAARNGNPGCADIAILLNQDGAVYEGKFDAGDISAGNSKALGSGSVTLTDIYTEDGWEFYDFEVTGDVEVFAVFFKQADGGALFDYTPGATTSDHHLHSSAADDVSHISFCAVDASDDPTDPPTEPTDPPTEPTDPPTEPTDPPTEPTDPPTEPTEEATTPAAQVLPDVQVLDEVAVADDELPATGGELTRLALLAALIAAFGAMLLMATQAAPRAAARKN